MDAAANDSLPPLTARPRLLAQHGVVAEHPDDDGTFRQGFDLFGGSRLIGCRAKPPQIWFRPIPDPGT